MDIAPLGGASLEPDCWEKASPPPRRPALPPSPSHPRSFRRLMLTSADSADHPADEEHHDHDAEATAHDGGAHRGRDFGPADQVVGERSEEWDQENDQDPEDRGPAGEFLAIA